MADLQSTVVFSLLDSPAFGGAEQYLFSQLQHLQKTGYKVVLATNNNQVAAEFSSRLTQQDKVNFQIVVAPYRLDVIGNWKGLVKFFIAAPGSLWWCYEILKQLRRQHSQIICLWVGFSDRLLFSSLARWLDCVLIWIDIGPLEPVFKKNWGFPRLFYSWAQRFPHYVVTTSQFTMDSLKRVTSLKEAHLGLLYPGVKLISSEQRSVLISKAKVWKRSLSVTTSKLVCVVARLAHENEIDMVLRAFSLYVRTTQNTSEKIKLIVIGDGPEKNELHQLARQLGVASSIEFMGFISEEQKQVILAASEYFIFPRAWELDGFGMTTIEAMALGLPVLTTNFGPQREIVRHGVEGFRYQPHSYRSLARAMRLMQSLPTSAKRKMSNNALKRAEFFSEQEMHKNVIAAVNTARQVQSTQKK